MAPQKLGKGALHKDALFLSAGPSFLCCRSHKTLNVQKWRVIKCWSPGFIVNGMLVKVFNRTPPTKRIVLQDNSPCTGLSNEEAGGGSRVLGQVARHWHMLPTTCSEKGHLGWCCEALSVFWKVAEDMWFIEGKGRHLYHPFVNILWGSILISVFFPLNIAFFKNYPSVCGQTCHVWFCAV